MKRQEYKISGSMAFWSLLLSLALNHGVLAQSTLELQEKLPVNSNTLHSNFAKMSFDAVLGKFDYFPLEPIRVKYKVSNLTSEMLQVRPIDFLNDTSLLVIAGNGSKEFDRFGPFISRGIPVRYPVYQPGEFLEREITVEIGLDKYFPTPGKYQLQFFLSTNGGPHKLESKLLKIEIKEPTGVNQEALAFLRQYVEKHRGIELFFAWDDEKDESGRTALEIFVSQFSESVYGELAIYRLGLFYLHRRETDKAKAEFEKLLSGKNPELAKSAKEQLWSIEKARRPH